MQQQITRLLELARLLSLPRFPQLNLPFTLILLPPTSYNFGVEGHILPQVERVAHFVQVLPDIRGIGKEARPIGLSNPISP